MHLLLHLSLRDWLQTRMRCKRTSKEGGRETQNSFSLTLSLSRTTLKWVDSIIIPPSPPPHSFQPFTMHFVPGISVLFSLPPFASLSLCLSLSFLLLLVPLPFPSRRSLLSSVGSAHEAEERESRTRSRRTTIQKRENERVLVVQVYNRMFNNFLGTPTKTRTAQEKTSPLLPRRLSFPGWKGESLLWKEERIFTSKKGKDEH